MLGEVSLQQQNNPLEYHFTKTEFKFLYTIVIGRTYMSVYCLCGPRALIDSLYPKCAYVRKYRSDSVLNLSERHCAVFPVVLLSCTGHITVESPNKGQLRTPHFVPCRKGVLFQRWKIHWHGR